LKRLQRLSPGRRQRNGLKQKRKKDVFEGGDLKSQGVKKNQTRARATQAQGREARTKKQKRRGKGQSTNSTNGGKSI